MNDENDHSKVLGVWAFDVKILTNGVKGKNF
jgi:hypothetical protein